MFPFRLRRIHTPLPENTFVRSPYRGVGPALPRGVGLQQSFEILEDLLGIPGRVAELQERKEDLDGHLDALLTCMGGGRGRQRREGVKGGGRGGAGVAWSPVPSSSIDGEFFKAEKGTKFLSKSADVNATRDHYTARSRRPT